MSSGKTWTLTDAITGSGGLTMNGSGTLLLAPGSGQTNTFTGGITVTSGVLSVSADAYLGNAANNITLNAGTLLTTNTFTTARGISLSGGGTVDASAGFLTVSGVISGSGGLATTGGGALILSGTNTYTGGTSMISNLSVSADANLGNASGGLTFSNNAVLIVTASFSSARAVTLGTVVSNPSFGDYWNVGAGKTLTLTGVIGGAGTLQADGARYARAVRDEHLPGRRRSSGTAPQRGRRR